MSNEKERYEQNESEPISEDEEFLELVLEAQKEALEKAREERLARLAGEKVNPKRQPPFARFLAWLIAIMLAFSTFAVIFEIFSIPAVEFIKKSASLSFQSDIQDYKKSVVQISTQDSKGTGFTVTKDGLIITNAHVIEDALSLTVYFPEDGIYEAEVIESYPEIDIAFIQVEGENLPHLNLAKTYEFTFNEAIYFIGNPLFFTGIANEGRILGTKALSDWKDAVYMMDAPVYKGNSGSPVINMDGEVIGVVFATIDDKEHGNVGLFVPIDLVQDRLND
ncbi:S1C family serine protease [Ureibacillus manganicus]|uniref:Peptidase S7 n=1 Tax=Ureibacillus manganicus DSM 26584 TaxID=1384049 RepID=A0A0A3I7A2_9BACL|nr:serine protease [Ureibacillus manganicus]KGR79380.1 peptidase S7 [Ureibacillus manganicus DSM 26584]